MMLTCSALCCAAPVAVAAPRDMLVAAGKAAGVSLAALALAAQAAGAVTIKMGGDTGALVFEPSNVKIKAGESVTWTNNAGFPHNVVFDEDEIPVRRWVHFGLPAYSPAGAYGALLCNVLSGCC